LRSSPHDHYDLGRLLSSATAPKPFCARRDLPRSGDPATLLALASTLDAHLGTARQLER